MSAERAELTWSQVYSPVGTLTLVASTRGLVRVAFETENIARILAGVQERLNATHMREVGEESSDLQQHLPTTCASGQIEEPAAYATAEVLKQAHGEIEEYFAGVRHSFSVALDTALLGGFHLEVIRAIERIPYGEVRSYGDVAAMTGHLGAARAVGTACRMNPLPLVVPCHRVIKADGTIGGYTPGLAIKRHLLQLEGADSGTMEP